MSDLSRRKSEEINAKNETFENFWLRVLTNNKIINDFISEEDKDVLKHLTNVSYTKLEDGNVIYK
jgi:hypothetical protein